MADTELLDDYTEATFPYEVKWDGSGGKVRLYAAFGNRVVGVSYYTYEHDGETVESLGQVLNWDGQGKFGPDGTSYPTMDLPPPPAKLAETVAQWQAVIAETQARLDANPHAPDEWRNADERRVKSLRDKIAELTGERAVIEQAAA